MTDGRDKDSGRLLPGHRVHPKRRGGPTDAELVHKRLSPHREAVLDKLAELAKLGDPRSQALFLSYLTPPARAEGDRVSIAGFDEATTLEQKASLILAAIFKGECTVDVGNQLLNALSLFAKTGMADEMERRLAALEARTPTKGTPP